MVGFVGGKWPGYRLPLYPLSSGSRLNAVSSMIMLNRNLKAEKNILMSLIDDSICF